MKEGSVQQARNARKDILGFVINIVTATLALNLWLQFLPSLVTFSHAILVIYAVLLTIAVVLVAAIYITLVILKPFYKSRLNIASGSELDEDREIVERIAEQTISKRSKLVYAFGLICALTVMVSTYQVGWYYLFAIEGVSEIAKYMLLDKLQDFGAIIQDRLARE